MSNHQTTLRDLRFNLEQVLGLPALMRECGDETFDADTAWQILEAAGVFASDVAAPLRASGDKEGCTYDANGDVRTPSGFKAAYAKFVEGGWPTLGCAPEYGGQGLPVTLTNAVWEVLLGANMAWTSYCSMSLAAYTCLSATADPQQKAFYLPRLASGEWAGTMCLTESQAGTDLGLLRTRAIPQPDGSYSITGTKIFISGGEQDMAANIVHLVLARLPDAPHGVKGISLFVVPKFLTGPDGVARERNPVVCGGIEAKLGINANSTCTMNFNGAKGWLLGEPNKGLAGMFVMMNHARVLVGVAAVGQMDGASQKAQAYAAERFQGRAPVRPEESAHLPADSIVMHPDVQRMLMTQRAWVEGSRALAMWASSLMDEEHGHPDVTRRRRATQLLSLATPVVKAFVSDNATESILMSMQCLGGHGYIRENGLEQYLRDARIIPLYEGTNGVQAMDLISRKVVADGGERLEQLLSEIEAFCAAARVELSGAFIVDELALLCSESRALTRTVLEAARRDPRTEGEVASAFLRVVGHLLLAWMWARMAVAAQKALVASDDGFYTAKLDTARFYFRRLLPEAHARCVEIRAVAAANEERAPTAH